MITRYETADQFVVIADTSVSSYSVMWGWLRVTTAKTPVRITVEILVEVKPELSDNLEVTG